MTKAEYFALPGLSQSGMKDLAVSPLRYWFLHINPDRPEDKPSAEQQFGNAVHCAVLEPEQFESRYAVECEASDYEKCLVTIADIREFITSKGHKPKGTLKADLIIQAHSIDSSMPILDIELARAARANEGKVVLSKFDRDRAMVCAGALREEPQLRPILEAEHAFAELSITTEENGVLLKGCLDWVWPGGFLDIKTFQQKSSASIDKTVTNAIFYEAYYRQMYFYAKLKGWPEWKGEAVMAFVESVPPHEVRIRSFQPKSGGQATLYWQRALLETRDLIAKYKYYSDRFGAAPWREDCKIEVLEDEEISQLAYS